MRYKLSAALATGLGATALAFGVRVVALTAPFVHLWPVSRF